MKHSMLLLVALVAAGTLCAATPRETALASLKSQFPAHISGPVTDRTDPTVRSCFFQFRNRVNAMTLESLPGDVGILRRQFDKSMIWHQWLNDFANSRDPRWKMEMRTPSRRLAIKQNLSWMKTKLRPYIARLESFQRGR